MSYYGFVRVDKEIVFDIYWWFIDNGFVAIPLPLSPYLYEIFISDVTPDQRILCIDYLSSVYGVVPYLFRS